MQSLLVRLPNLATASYITRTRCNPCWFCIVITRAQISSFHSFLFNAIKTMNANKNWMCRKGATDKQYICIYRPNDNPGSSYHRHAQESILDIGRNYYSYINSFYLVRTGTILRRYLWKNSYYYEKIHLWFGLQMLPIVANRLDFFRSLFVFLFSIAWVCNSSMSLVSRRIHVVSKVAKQSFNRSSTSELQVFSRHWTPKYTSYKFR